MKIIIDVMGSDNGADALVTGAVRALKEIPDIETVLVGDSAEIKRILGREGASGDRRISVVHTTEVIDMHDSPSLAFRRKKDSSMSVALNMLASGEGDAMLSAGSTGALLAGSTFVVKRIPGIRRPALAPAMPTKSGKSLLIDCGANVVCTPEDLLQFAYMGSCYTEKQLGINNPRVGLINNGAEDSKGTPVYVEAYKLLKEAGEKGEINFVGNVEGRDIAMGAADVLVCDGFTGNVVLKTYEGLGLYLVGILKGMFKKNIATKLAALLVSSGLKDLKKSMDYKEVGGAPLLGISRPVIKAHGSSDPEAAKSAIRQACVFARGGFIGEIEKKARFMSQEKNGQNPEENQ
ncbi:MAG: phosphate acyltransferase PlsX [Clostridiaceae bacterium]|nr:phosphate acyltransferase PlsX [Clostridiaceae bacterium]